MIGPLLAALFYKIHSAIFFPVVIALFVTSHLIFLHFHRKSSQQNYENVDDVSIVDGSTNDTDNYDDENKIEIREGMVVVIEKGSTST